MIGYFQSSPEIRKVYGKIVPGPSSPPEVKLDAILSYVFEAIDGEGGDEWLDPTRAILLRQGSRIPVAAALLDLAGIPWDVLLAEPVPNQNIKSDLPRLGQYSDPVLEVRLPGEDKRYYQLSSPYRTPGLLPWYLQGAKALAVTSKTPSTPVVLPRDLGPWSGTLEKEMQSLLGNGDLAVAHQQIFDPDTSEAFRSAFQRIPKDQWEQAVQITLSREYGNLDLKSLDMSALEDTEVPFSWNYEIVIQGFAVPDGNRWVVREPLPVLDLSQGLASLKERTLPLAPGAPIFLNQEFRMALPEGLRTDYRPPSLFIETPFGSYSLEGTWEEEGRTLFFRRSLEIPYQIVPPEDYPAFARFLREIDRVEAGRMILYPAPET